jgi:hypothetical protein
VALGVRDGRMVENFAGMAEGHGWRRRPIDGQGGALQADPIGVHRHVCPWLPSPHGEGADAGPLGKQSPPWPHSLQATRRC